MLLKWTKTLFESQISHLVNGVHVCQTMRSKFILLPFTHVLFLQTFNPVSRICLTWYKQFSIIVMFLNCCPFSKFCSGRPSVSLFLALKVEVGVVIRKSPAIWWLRPQTDRCLPGVGLEFELEISVNYAFNTVPLRFGEWDCFIYETRYHRFKVFTSALA